MTCLFPQDRGLRTAALWVLIALTMACRQAAPSAPVALLGVPGHRNEHVSIATDGDTLVTLAWAASSESTGTNIFASVSTDGGRSFSPPVRVNTVARQANVNGEQPPRVVVRRDTSGAQSIVVLWTARTPEGTRLLSAQSLDAGRTFGANVLLPGLDAPGNRGWESMTVAEGRVYALWLDHREAVQSAADHQTHAHRHGGGAAAPATDGVARAQRSQLFVATLDGSLSPKGIARGVCYCCKTALTAGADGAVYAAWRHVYEGNRRDIAFTVSRDGGRSFAEPVRVSEDEWQIEGCPENGPALTVDSRNRIHVVWPTLVRGPQGEHLQLFYASSADGRTFTPRTALPTVGDAFHPHVVTTADGGLLAAWDELANGKRVVKMARLASPGGRERFEPIGDSGDMSGLYPALAATREHAVLAWSQRTGEESRIAVKNLPPGRP